MDEGETRLLQQISLATYAPDGERLGTFDVSVNIKDAGDGRQRVRETYTTEDIPIEHPVRDLLGVRSYQREQQAQSVIFKGPDLLLTTKQYGNCLHGHGFMPQAGFNVSLTEWATDAGAYLYYQLSRASEPVATLVGVRAKEWQALRGAKWPAIRGVKWQGTIQTHQPSGLAVSKQELKRRYDGLQFADHVDGQRTLTVELELWAPYYIVSGSTIGIAKLYDWALVIEAADSAQSYLRAVEVFDEAAGKIVGLHQWYQDSILRTVSVLGLGL